MGNRAVRVALVGVCLGVAYPAQAQGTEPSASPLERDRLRRYLDAMAERRLLAVETGSVHELRRLVSDGEQLYLRDRYDEAVLPLYEVVESPRFADFSELSEVRAAEFMLASAMQRLDALTTAFHYLERIIARGSSDSYFGPAFRRAVDVALQAGDPALAVQRLSPYEKDLTEDAQNELRYVRGRAHYDRGEAAEAIALLSKITKRSRFYANARYLQGVLAARGKDYEKAEAEFCAIAGSDDDNRYNFYVDDRYFKVKDLARLALGRVAHEQGRGDDAFYYYFQVPQDSPQLSAAMFEAAYAMYEAQDHDTALDLLDQLQARFPDSPFSDESWILRGYVALARCDFERADRLFQRFIEHFRPVVGEARRVLQNPVRQRALVRDLRRAQAQGGTRARRTLFALLQVDPAFYRLNAQVRTLDAEAARASRVHDALDVILARYEGSERPREAAPQRKLATDQELFASELEDAHASLAGLTGQLDVLRRSGKRGADVRRLEKQVAELGVRLDRVVSGFERALVPPTAPAATQATPSGALTDLMREDLVVARSFGPRAAQLRQTLLAAANAQALKELAALERRLSSWLRRAKIGRIDAIMGSKRRIEIQIEGLAAGRFPPELRDPLLIQGLLSDDEEYWPFEGDDWPDEYIEPANEVAEP